MFFFRKFTWSIFEGGRTGVNSTEVRTEKIKLMGETQFKKNLPCFWFQLFT